MEAIADPTVRKSLPQKHICQLPVETPVGTGVASTQARSIAFKRGNGIRFPQHFFLFRGVQRGYFSL
jgi:hypothetical protein